MPTSRPVSNRAHLAFERGKHFFNQWNAVNAAEARDHFLQVIELEPSFLPAYNWLAKTYIFQAGRGYRAPRLVYPEAIEINTRALAMAPESGEALILKGIIDFFYLLDWESCYQHIKRGIANEPTNAEAYQNLSFFWYGMKEYDQSLAALHAALEFDPLSISTLNMIADLKVSQSQWREAERDFLDILKLNHDNVAALENLGHVATIGHNRARAFHFFNKLLRRVDTSANIPRLGHAYAHFEMEPETTEYIEMYEALRQQHPDKVYVNRMSQVYVGLRDWDRVMELISEGWRERTGILYVLTDPMLDPIRKRPQYLQLLREIKWPTQLGKTQFVSLGTSTNSSVKINLDVLLYLEADDNYVQLYLYQNFRLERQIIRQTLSRLLLQLPRHFMRVHRRFAVNRRLSLVATGNSRGMTLSCRQYDFTIPVSRQYVAEVRATSFPSAT